MIADHLGILLVWAMIKLYQFPPVWRLPNGSPFCLKLETYLRMARIPFESVSTLNPNKAPKGKLPYIVDGDKTIADSNFIIEYLISAYGDRLEKHLTPEQRAWGLMLRRMVDENLYWCLMYARWIEDRGWVETKESFFSTLPLPLRWFVPNLARRNMRRQIMGHGIGRHNRNEIYKIGMADLSALSDALGRKTFFLGEYPSIADATAYGLLANLLWPPLKNPLKDWLLTLPNLVSFCHTVRERYYLNQVAEQLELAVGL